MLWILHIIQYKKVDSSWHVPLLTDSFHLLIFIWTARSDNSTLQSFREFDYKKGLGPGLYDIHSPVVPTVGDLQTKLEGENSTILGCRHSLARPSLDCGSSCRGQFVLSTSQSLGLLLLCIVIRRFYIGIFGRL